MKELLGKKLALALALGAAVTGTTLYAAPLALASVSDAALAAEAENSATKGVTAWEEGKIVACGIGVPPANALSPAQGRALALTAARIEAMRNLLTTAEGIQLSADTTIENLMVSNDTIKTHVEGSLKGAKMVGEPKFLEDGSCIVTMSAPLYGATSLASAVMPEYAKTIEKQDFAPVTPSYAPPQEVQTIAYTGVVIDAAGMGLEGTFSPVIYDTNGRIVYGAQNIDYTAAINNGMVGYARELTAATSGSSRAGTNPLVLKAVEVRGGKNSTNPVNVVVSVEDADKILYANAKSGFLSKCAVVFVR